MNWLFHKTEKPKNCFLNDRKINFQQDRVKKLYSNRKKSRDSNLSLIEKYGFVSRTVHTGKKED